MYFLYRIDSSKFIIACNTIAQFAVAHASKNFFCSRTGETGVAQGPSYRSKIVDLRPDSSSLRPEHFEKKTCQTGAKLHIIHKLHELYRALFLELYRE